MCTLSSSSSPFRLVGLGGTQRPASISARALDAALGAVTQDGLAQDSLATESLLLQTLDLPTFKPEAPLSEYAPVVPSYLDTIRSADALLVSTAAYHGTVAGVTKNALDLLELLADDDPAYLTGKAVGLIAVSGGDSAGVQALNALTHAAHALRAVVVPRSVFIPRAAQAVDDAGDVAPRWRDRLATLATDTVDLATP